MPPSRRSMRRAPVHRPATPSSLEDQVQRDLETIPRKHFPVWGKTIGYKRNQAHFLLLPEHCEQGKLTPMPEGYAYERTGERLKCDNIYCKRYMDAMQTIIRSPSTGHAEAEANPLPAQHEFSNQGDHVLGQGEERRGSFNELGDTALYATVNPHYPQVESYNAINSILEYPAVEDPTYLFTFSQEQSMDAASSSTSGLELYSRPNPPWDSDHYDQI